MDKKESVKIKNPLARRFFAALVIFLIMLGIGGYGFYNSFFSGRAPGQDKNFSRKSSPVSSPVSSPNLAPNTSAVDDTPRFYAYKLDFVAFAGVVRFRLGLAWIPREDFPYKIIKKGTDYFAVIPSSLLPNLDNDNRALPIVIKQKET